MGARVPTYVISPWSRGGWVNSQVFDHTSVGQFIVKRFGVTIPAISPWSRAVSGDLTSAFNFVNPNDPSVPTLPDMSDYEAIEAASKKLPTVSVPGLPEPLYQESGTRFSRALPYELHTNARINAHAQRVTLVFVNRGDAGAVFHVYDNKHLDRIPRRYTVESGKTLEDEWDVHYDGGVYDFNVYRPNGYFRHFKGAVSETREPSVRVGFEVSRGGVQLKVRNPTTEPVTITITDNAYGLGGPWTHKIRAGDDFEKLFWLRTSGNWYDFTVTSSECGGCQRRAAGRVETGKDSFSDPVLVAGLG